MKRCKHDDRITKIVWRNDNGDLVKKRCDCGAWLSLGPSNDTPEVEIEIEAARLAAFYAPQDFYGAWKYVGVFSDAWLLAAVIATHGEDS